MKPEIEQKSNEWIEQRLGKFTASQFFKLMTEPKLKADKEAGNLSAGSRTHVLERVAEALTGRRATAEFTSRATEWGNEHEPIAKNVYERVFGCAVEDSGYIAFSDYVGGSPDGLVGEDGLIEIKCPETITAHLEHTLNDLRDKPIYYWQCIGYLLITGRKWIDFISYSPHYPAKLQLKRIRLNRVDVLGDIKALEAKLVKAVKMFEEIMEKLNNPTPIRYAKPKSITGEQLKKVFKKANEPKGYTPAPMPI